MNIADRKMTAPADTRAWLDSFAAALQANDAPAAAALFIADGLWRDLLAFTWTIETVGGRDAIAAMLTKNLARTQPQNFHIPAKRTPPRWVSRAGKDCIEAIFEFDTAFGPCHGTLRLIPDQDGQFRAWTINTNLQELRGHEELFKRRAAEADDGIRAFGGDNWLDRLSKQRAFADRDPAVLVVGGGQAGLAIAARLQQLGVDTLIVDRHKRVGDNWRTRYHSLTLHNEMHVNHLPYMPFPPTFPTYIPKDKLANWFEAYVESLELNFWTDTALVSGRYDEGTKAMGRHAAPRRWQRTRHASAPSDFRHRRQQHSDHARPAGLARFFRRQGAFRIARAAPSNGKAAKPWCSAPAPAATTPRRNCTRVAPTSR